MQKYLPLLCGFSLVTRGASHCTPELLRADNSGNYFRLVEDEQQTTCAKLTDGACKLAVPAPGYPCLVSCVSSEEECAKLNPQAPSINPWEDDKLCTSCPVTACKSCHYPERDGAVQCLACFDGFELLERRDGTHECVVVGQGAVVITAYVLMFVITILVVLVMFGTCYVAAAESWRSKGKGNATVADLGAPLMQSASQIDENELPIQELDSKEAKQRNANAISHGFKTSIQASIKFNSLQRAKRRDENRIRRFLRAAFDKQDDLGIGLQLFYNTQIFLICFSLLGLAMSYMFTTTSAPGDSLVKIANTASSTCPASAAELRQLESSLVGREYERAKMGQVFGVLFWIASVMLTWAFHYYQKLFQQSFDAYHQTEDDYTLMLEGVPKNVTSEKQLHQQLEQELSMEGRIYGVCILYDLLHLPSETQEKLEDMLEHIIELDDLRTGWAHATVSAPEENLIHSIKEDEQEFREIMRNHIRCCGRAYVVFQTQSAMLRVLRERSGIRKQILDPSSTSDELEMVRIVNRGDQPAGLRYEKAELTGPERAWTLSVLPARQFVYILIYVVSAQLFFYFMQKPWHDCAMEASSGAAGVQLASKGVLLVNFAIQTAVAFDVEACDFIRVSKVDEITFIWNTLLMVITLLYIVYQECDKVGMRPTFFPPEEEYSAAWWEWRRGLLLAALAEIRAYDALLSVFTEQTIMLYVLGEVGNVLAPVLFFWLALRAVFISNIGGTPTSRIQRLLRVVLPKTRSPSVLSHREAEKAQVLVPLLLWMEYTYVILFPVIALTSVYFVDHSMKVWQALLCFSLLFFLWQRYVMLWLYGKSQFDSDGTYFSFIVVWGFVLSQCAASFAVWAYRLEEITEWPFAILIFVLIFFLTFFIYLAGVLYIEWSFSKAGKALDSMDGTDPGYGKIMEDTGISWWNVNPVYVLKHRLCPQERGYEVHDETVACWPSWSNQGFFEKGKEARHRKRDSWRDQAARDEPAAVAVVEATKGASINGAGGANGEQSTQSSPPDRLITSAARTIPVGLPMAAPALSGGLRPMNQLYTAPYHYVVNARGERVRVDGQRYPTATTATSALAARASPAPSPTTNSGRTLPGLTAGSTVLSPAPAYPAQAQASPARRA
ncbi:hypothetical protein AK812_SmicGene28834 [Symbiodinium microadriaticum]|uniref:Uncharacterized protein n=1 Tax=Symbiodinium microadriaticum TaxID=2951 RepID=A0A1Q9D3I6_SYMMI|nr:hypothetical protein AK812_SmicGene28834 [Symbiodinium microadriaticum]